MKKFLLIFILLIHFSIHSEAQMTGYGIAGGVTVSRQKFINPPLIYTNDRGIRTRFNGCIFAEWFNHDYFRLITELQYNQKGSKEKVYGAKYKNSVDYAAFNTFLKWRTELYNTTPYLLAGPRFEFLVRRNAQVFPEVIEQFRFFHIGYSVGIGMEYFEYEPWIWFAEFHVNPDLMNAYKKDIYSPPFSIKNQALELRIGLKFSHFKSNEDDCPPVFTGL